MRPDGRATVSRKGVPVQSAGGWETPTTLIGFSRVSVKRKSRSESLEVGGKKILYYDTLVFSNRLNILEGDIVEVVYNGTVPQDFTATIENILSPYTVEILRQ